MAQFISDNYALMRHAYCLGDSEGDTVLGPDSVAVIEQVTAILAQEIRDKKIVEIYYSPKRRAWFTTREVMRILSGMGFEVASEKLTWLDNRNGITNFLIEPLLPRANPDTFILFIGHQPDIAKYLGLIGENSYSLGNCSIRAMNFCIDRHSL